MKPLGALEKLILIVNTVGLSGYLLWLVMGSERIFYTQEGVLYLLPCVPFFFVYAFLFHPARRRPRDSRENPHG